MIHINIIGKGYLHLRKDTEFGLKKENHLYRFSDISLARTSEFDVVDDEHNRTLLDLAGDPAMYGEAMRKRWDAQLQTGLCEVSGSLAVTSYSDGDFHCVFYLEASDTINTLVGKKMSELPVRLSERISWSLSATVHDANEPEIGSLALVRYENGINDMTNWQYLPSIDIDGFFDILTFSLEDIGVQFKINFRTPEEYRLVFGTLNGGGEYNEWFNILTPTSASMSDGRDISVVTVTAEWARSLVLGMYLGGGSAPVVGFKPNKDLKIQFRSFTPSDCYLVRMDSSLGSCEVIGGGSALSPWGGTPLANRTFNLKRDKVYCFFKHGVTGLDGNGTYWGWKDTDVYAPANINAVVTVDGDMQLGDTWSLSDNMPDMTLFEFLKSVALATGHDLEVRTKYNVGAGINETQATFVDTAMARQLDLDLVKVYGKYISGAGSISSNSSRNYVEADVTGLSRVSFLGILFRYSYNVGYAFYDANNVVLSSERYDNLSSLSDTSTKVYELAVPAGAAKLRWTTRYQVSNDSINITSITYATGIMNNVTYRFIDSSKVISVDRVSRTVDAWGEGTGKVTVKFDSEDYVTDPLRSEYAIDNGNLTEEEEAVSKFNDGEQGDNGVLIRDVEIEGGTPSLKEGRCTITRVDAGSIWLQRLEAPRMPSYSDIAANSTFVTARVKASEGEFLSLDYSDVIVMRGQMYVWTNAEWSGGVMTLELQKISQQ